MRGEQQIFEDIRSLCVTLNMSAGPGEERAFPPLHRRTTEKSPHSRVLSGDVMRSSVRQTARPSSNRSPIRAAICVPSIH